MKKSVWITVLCFVCLPGFYFSSTGFQPAPEADALRDRYLRQCDTLLHIMQQWAQSGNDTSLSRQQQHYREARKAFKKISFLVEFIDPGTAKQINGPNLPYADLKSPNPVELQAHTFQTLEELLYSGEPVNYQELHQEVLYVASAIRDWRHYAGRLSFTGSQWTASIKQELVFLFTMGLTGFDSPISMQSLEEGLVSLQSVHTYFNLLESGTRKKAQEVQALFAQSERVLAAASSFNDFDRLGYYRGYLAPLHSAIIRWQQQAGIEFAIESTPFQLPYADTAGNIFSPGFLNTQYFGYSKYRGMESDSAATALGERLFFDPVLSKGIDRSCASCHLPAYAFGENKATSMGTGKPLTRNAPSLIFASLQEKQFWDARAEKLEDQPEHVILNPEEFGSDYALIAERLRTSPEYAALFRKAFPRDENAIGSLGVTRALSAYIRSLVRFNSPFDRYMRGETNTLPSMAVKGFNLFMGKAKCGTCHFAPVFNGTVPPAYLETETEVLGTFAGEQLSKREQDKDPGRYAATAVDIHRYSFKTPSARNTGFTTPYMHNGAFRSLDSLIAFYNFGGAVGMGLDLPNQTLPPDSLHLDAREIEALKAFLHSIDDSSVIDIRAPRSLPAFPGNAAWTARSIGGRY